MEKRLEEKEIANLLNNQQYPELIKSLSDVVTADDAKFNELAAFIIAVEEYGDRKNYPLAFDCFVKANLRNDLCLHIISNEAKFIFCKRNLSWH